MFWKTTRGKALRRTDFSKGYHTFGIEWSKDYLFTYLDSRLQQVLYMNFRGSKTLWDRGDFASKVDNGVLLQNPWNTTGNTQLTLRPTLLLNFKRSCWVPRRLVSVGLL